MSDQDVLHTMTYKSLQKIAASVGIPTNIKKVEMIRRIREINAAKSRKPITVKNITKCQEMPECSAPIIQPKKAEYKAKIVIEEIKSKTPKLRVPSQRIKCYSRATRSATLKINDESSKTLGEDHEKKQIVISTTETSLHSEPQRDVHIQSTINHENILCELQKILWNKKQETDDQNTKKVTDNVTITCGNTVTYENSEEEGVLAFTRAVLHFYEVSKEQSSIEEASEFENTGILGVFEEQIPSIGNYQQVTLKNMKSSDSLSSSNESHDETETVGNDIFDDTGKQITFKIIHCPAYNCNRIVRIKRLSQHLRWIHTDFVSYRAENKIDINLCDMQKCGKIVFFQILDEFVYITFAEYIDGLIYLAVKYLQDIHEIDSTAILRINQGKVLELTWKGKVKPYCSFKMNFKEYHTMGNVYGIYGRKKITIGCTIITDKKTNI